MQKRICKIVIMLLACVVLVNQSIVCLYAEDDYVTPSAIQQETEGHIYDEMENNPEAIERPDTEVEIIAETSNEEVEDQAELEKTAEDASGDGSLEEAPEVAVIPECDLDMVTEDMPNVVYNEDQLRQWCEDNAAEGGTVSFGDTITLTDSIDAYRQNGYITFRTNQYGLIYDGGSIVSYNYEIIGEGVDVPVLDVYDIGIFRLSWNRHLQDAKITATGRDGVGGTALRISQGDEWSADILLMTREGLIWAYGEGAIGLYLAPQLYVYCFNIEVEGRNSTAVYAPQGADLYYCKLRAAGEGADVVSGEAIVLDTCATTPSPTNVNEINWCIEAVSGNDFYTPVPKNENFRYNELFSFLLTDDKDNFNTFESLYVLWDSEQLDNIDTSIIGEISVDGTLYAPFQGLGLEDNFPIKMIVDVREPALPCISDIFFSKDEDRNVVELEFWDNFERGSDKVILWRSDDEGLTWYDYSDAPDIKWDNYYPTVNFYYTEITKPIQFQLEIVDKGESNVITLYYYGGGDAGGLGGDRTGTDRVVTTKPGNANKPDDKPIIEEPPNHEGESEEKDTSDKETQPATENSQKISVKQLASALQIQEESKSVVSQGRILVTPDSELIIMAQAVNMQNTNTENATVDAGTITAENNNMPSAQTQSVNDKTMAPAVKTAEAVYEPKEWEDDNTIAISGKRLAAMIEAKQESIVFVKQDIQIVVPTDALRALQIGDTQLFVVTIEKQSKDSSDYANGMVRHEMPEGWFTVNFTLDGILLTNLPYTAYIDGKIIDVTPVSLVVPSLIGLDISDNGSVYPIKAPLLNFGLIAETAQTQPQASHILLFLSMGIILTAVISIVRIELVWKKKRLIHR